MSRKQLKPLNGKVVLGVGRRGKISCVGGCLDAHRIVLEDVIINDEIEIDHVWIDPKKGIPSKKGEYIAFKATVVSYTGVDDDGRYIEKFGLRKLRHISVNKSRQKALMETKDKYSKELAQAKECKN